MAQGFAYQLSLPFGPAGGDLGGQYPNPIVVSIGGIPFNPSNPAAGNILVADGFRWNSVTPSGSIVITASGSIYLANTGVTPGTYGSTGTIPVITVGPDGRVTNLSIVTNPDAVLNLKGVNDSVGNILIADGIGYNSFSISGAGALSPQALLTLTPTGVIPGFYGSSSVVASFQVNAAGQLIGASGIPISISGTQVSFNNAGTDYSATTLQSGLVEVDRWLNGTEVFPNTIDIKANNGITLDTSAGAGSTVLTLNANGGVIKWTGGAMQFRTGSLSSTIGVISTDNTTTPTQYIIAGSAGIDTILENGNGLALTLNHTNDSFIFTGDANAYISVSGMKITNLQDGSAPQDAVAFSQLPTGLPPSGNAGGVLTGVYPNPSGLAFTGVTKGTYGSNNQVAQVTINGEGRVTSASNVTINFPAIPNTAIPSGAAGGVLTGTYPNPSGLTFTGVAVGTYGSNNQVAQVTVNGEGRVTSASNVTINFPAIPNTAIPSGAAGGDLGNTYPNPSVVKINSNPLGATTPTAGNLLIADGTRWNSVAMSGLLGITASGSIYQVSSPGIITYGSSNQVAQITLDQYNRITTASNVTINFPAIPNTAIPSGAAGGDLSNTYPNPTVAKILGIPLEGINAIKGNHLIADGTGFQSVATSGDVVLAPNAGLGSLNVIGINSNPLGVTTPVASRILVADGTRWNSVSPSGVLNITPSGSTYLSATTVTAGVYGSSTQVPIVTVGADGRLTSVTLASINSGITSPLPVASGGTGNGSTFTAGSVVFAGTNGIYVQDNTNFYYTSGDPMLSIGSAFQDPNNPPMLQLSNNASDTSYNVIVASGSVNNYFQVLTQNYSNGTAASSDLVLNMDIGSENNYYVDLGINSSKYNQAAYNITASGDAYIINSANNLAIGNSNPGNNIKFFTGGTQVQNLRMLINDSLTDTVYVSGSLRANTYIATTNGAAASAVANQVVIYSKSTDTNLYAKIANGTEYQLTPVPPFAATNTNTSNILVANGSAYTSVALSGDVSSNSALGLGYINVNRIASNLLGSTTPTASGMLIADGTRWNSVQPSGDIYINPSGSVTVRGLGNHIITNQPTASGQVLTFYTNNNLQWQAPAAGGGSSAFTTYLNGAGGNVQPGINFIVGSGIAAIVEANNAGLTATDVTINANKYETLMFMGEGTQSTNSWLNPPLGGTTAWGSNMGVYIPEKCTLDGLSGMFGQASNVGGTTSVIMLRYLTSGSQGSQLTAGNGILLGTITLATAGTQSFTNYFFSTAASGVGNTIPAGSLLFAYNSSIGSWTATDCEVKVRLKI